MEIGNFLDFRPEEYQRMISIVVDFALITHASGSITESSTYTQIGSLSSDLEITLMFRFWDSKYELTVGFLGSTGIQNSTL